MAQAVYTRRKRIQFIQKELADCGDYTDYPLEVTGATVRAKFGKISEIFYRVKFAQFTANGLFTDGSTFFSGVTTGAISPRIMTASDGGIGAESTLLSGYWCLDDLGHPVAASAEAFLSAQYAVDLQSGLALGFPMTTPLNFRDISNRESGLFLEPEDEENPTWNTPMDAFVGMGFYFYSGVGVEHGIDEQNFKTAFSHYSISPAGTLTPPTIPIPWVTQFLDPDTIYEELAVLVEFSGYVAWVGESLFHPDTRYFVGMRFLTDMLSGFAQCGTGGIFAADPTTARYVMRLSSGDLACPIGSPSPFVVGDIVHEAIEWWPYAAGNPAAPVWDTATGLPL